VFSLNILLGTFNLIPVPPLDGFNVVPLFLSEGQGQRYLEWADSVRRYSLVGLMVAWLLYYKMFWPIFTVAVQTLYR
jgi:Zn-dependent protease